MTRLPRGASHFKWHRQRHQNTRRWPTLNLVALMDVFTILVFYFLVHSADSTPQAYADLVQLPESIAEQLPRDTPVIMITRDDILLQGESIVAVDTAMQASRGGIKALRAALLAQLTPDAMAGTADNGEGDPAGGGERELTIMGDRSIPFEVLNRVMRTCAEAGYGDISLSVVQRSSGAG